MVRVKVPHGSLVPEQLEMLGYLADEYSRGWAPPHHPPERADALRAAGADARAAAPAGVGRPDDPGGVWRHRPQRDGLPSRRRVPVRGARHQSLGKGDDRLLPAQPVRAAHAAQVQDQLLGLRHRLRSGHVQRRRRHRRQPAQARRHARARLQGVRGRRARCQPAPGAGARGVHAARAAHADARGDRACVRPLRQPRQQAAGAHEVARRHHGHGGAARAHLQGAQVPARSRQLRRVESPTRSKSTATPPPARARAR